MTIIPCHNNHQGAGSIIFLPHGGGPLPLLGDPRHREMVDFLRQITPTLITPSAILVISAHWEEALPTVTSGKTPSLIYDYYGFPEESYAIRYRAPGNPELANRIQQLMGKSSIRAALSADRGFDHGLFIPLNIMYPQADIPCLQISLCKSLAPQEHLQLGKALAPLRQDNLLVVGSGFSFHNLRAFFQKPTEQETSDNESFQQWLIETCTSRQLSAEDREKRLTEWEKAPAARYCHPREEHLLPLHVCCGMAGEAATQAFTLDIMGKMACALIWQQ